MRSHFHTTTFSSGTYFAFPLVTLFSTVVVFNGVGIRRTTSVADNLLLKFALTETVYDTCVVPISVTLGMIRRGNLTFEVDRYLFIMSKMTQLVTRGPRRTASTQILRQVE